MRQLKARISKLQKWLKEEQENTEPPTLADYIQVILSRKAQTGKMGYSQSLYNLKDAAKMLNFLQANGIMDIAGLDEKFKSMIGEASLFTGKLVCADCGHPLVAARETQRRKNGTVKHYTSYFCSRFATTGHSICSWHRIFEISLKNLVLSEIRAHGKAVAADEAAVLDKLKQHIQSASAAQQEDCRQEISRLRRRLEELEQITAKLYEDKVSGAISGDSFSVLIQKNEQERIQKSERLDSLLAGERKAQQDIANIHQWAGTIRQYLDLQELNREIIEELIDRIEVGERTVIDGQRHQDIKIYYRFVGLV